MSCQYYFLRRQKMKLPDLRPKMFEEASKSHASKKLPIIILIFILVFIIIMILESIVPGIVSIKPMLDEINSGGYLDDPFSFTMEKSMELATKVASAPAVMISSLFATIFGTIASLIYCRCIEMRPVRSMGARKQKLVPHYLQGLLIGIILMTVVTLLSVLLGINSIKLCSSINFGLIALYFLGFFVQGMSEEFIFRGYFMNSIGAGSSALLAVGISSVAFALAHTTNPGFGILPFINLVLFGVFAGLYMILFDDIWGACAIHSIWNFTQGNFYGISVSGSSDTESVFRTTAKTSHAILSGGDFGIEGSIITTVVLLAATALVFCGLCKKYPAKTAE